MRVFRIENFTVEQLMAASDLRSNFDLALVFSTKYEPRHPWFERWRTWQQWKTQFFGYHRDVPPAAAAQLLGGRLVYNDTRDGQWAGVIEMEQVEEATSFTPETQRHRQAPKLVLSRILSSPLSQAIPAKPLIQRQK